MPSNALRSRTSASIKATVVVTAGAVGAIAARTAGAVAIGARTATVVTIGAIVIALGCSSSSTKPSSSPTPAPDRIQDLRAESKGSAGVMLKWTAPHAGSDAGAAVRYDIRLATVAIADSNWASADTVAGEPIPASPGSADSFLVRGLDGETTYHFAIRSQDAEAHLSPISNDASVNVIYGAPKSVSAVLSNLLRIWNNMEYDEYARLLDPAYMFVFASQDVGGSNNIPASWGLIDELASAGHLFSRLDYNREGYIADSLLLSFDSGPEIPNDLGSWTKVVISNVFLTVYSRNVSTNDPMDFLVQRDQANLWFVQEGGLWHLIRWEDRPIGGIADVIGGRPVLEGGKAVTWGSIKGRWE